MNRILIDMYHVLTSHGYIKVAFRFEFSYILSGSSPAVESIQRAIKYEKGKLVIKG